MTEPIGSSLSKLEKQWEEWSGHKVHCIHFRQFQIRGHDQGDSMVHFAAHFNSQIADSLPLMPDTEGHSDRIKTQLSSIYIFSL